MNKFAKAKQDAIANAHRAALRVRLLDQPSVRAMLALFPRNLRKDVFVSCADFSNTVTFSIWLRNLDSLKDKKLMRVLEPFATDPSWTSTSSDFTHDVPNRDYHFHKKTNIPMPSNEHSRWLDKHGYFWHDNTMLPVDIRVSVYAYVKADSDACRIEVVDRVEKVVIEEVKRIVCA